MLGSISNVCHGQEGEPWIACHTGILDSHLESHSKYQLDSPLTQELQELGIHKHPSQDLSQ